MKIGGSVVFLAVVVLFGAAFLALSILSTAFGREKFGGDMYITWSSDTGVWLAELAFAGLAVLVAALSIVATRARARLAGGWLGLGVLALGAISIAAGWTGLQVPSPGIDALERGELIYILGGAVAVVLGLVFAAAGFLASSVANDS